MGNKVDIQEVIALSDKTANAKEAIQTDFTTAMEPMKQLNDMETFKGQAAEAAKYYFSEFHQSIIDAIQLLFIEIDSNLDNSLEDFSSSVDSSDHARIKQSYIENEKEALDSLHEEYESLSEKINSTIDDVSDLITVVNPSITYLNYRKRESIKKMEKVVENMGNFANQKKSDDINEMLEHIRTLMSHAKAEKGEDRFTTFYRGDPKKAKAKLDKWVDKNRDKTAVEHVEEKGKNVTNAFKYAKLGNLAGQAAPMAYALSKMSSTERNRFLRTGMHSMIKGDLIRHNNMSTLTNIFKVSKNDLLRLGKQTAKDPKNFLKHLKSGPFSDVRGKDAMKKVYDNIHGLDKYKELKKLSPGKQAWSAAKTFGNEFLGNKIKTTTKLIKNTNWKKPQTFVTESVKEVKNSTKGLNTLGKLGKLAGPAGVGLDIVSNFTEHKDNPQKAIVGSVVDVGANTAAAATGAAVGSFIVPPIGTVVGAGVGVLISGGLNWKRGTPPKSILDKTKDGVNKTINKVTSWFK